MRALVVTAFLVGCSADNHCLEHGNCTDSKTGTDDVNADGGPNGATGSAAPMCTVFGVQHIGLGNIDVASQDDGPPSGDRARMKPYTALLSEYGRVLGGENAPTLVRTAGPTFGVPSDRWYFEPLPSAVVLSTAFEVAFEGCSSLTANVKFDAAPTADSAHATCTDWTRRFWSRDTAPAELDACVSTALDTTSETFGRPGVDETTRAVTPRRRWAYACASVLTATGFLSY